jgi:hypothetical protein
MSAAGQGSSTAIWLPRFLGSSSLSGLSSRASRAPLTRAAWCRGRPCQGQERLAENSHLSHRGEGKDGAAMAPLPLRDLVRGGTVAVAMAHAAGGLHTLPGCVDGVTGVAGRPPPAQHGRRQKHTPASRPPAPRQSSRERGRRAAGQFPRVFPGACPAHTKIRGKCAKKGNPSSLRSARNSEAGPAAASAAATSPAATASRGYEPRRLRSAFRERYERRRRSRHQVPITTRMKRPP